MDNRRKAVWIWRSRVIRINDFAYFRKVFRTKSGTRIGSAILQVSAHNTAQVYLDSRRIGGYGSPAPTDPFKRKYFNEYDVTAYCLESGEAHCLTADAHYLGGSGQNYVNGVPGFWLRLVLVYEDGSQQQVVSGPSWDVLRAIPHQVGTPYQQNRRISAIEAYDARKWDPDWRRADWKGELPTAKAKRANEASESWLLEPQRIPEGRVEQEIVPAEVTQEGVSFEIESMEDRPDFGSAGARPGIDSAVQVFDAGCIVSGWPRLKLPGRRGVTIRMRYSEDLDGQGRVRHNVCNESSEHYYDQYTMRGDDEETWQPAFSYKAFRYVEVTGYLEPIVPGEGIVICFAHTDLHNAGHFECSDPFLNDLYTACIRTQKNNVLGQTVDCPHREQAQYLADTDLQAETLLYNFDARETLRKTLADFADAQLEDGTFPFVAPINYAHKDFHIRIPEWDLHYASLLWKLYESEGDVKLLADCYEPMRRMADAYVRRIDPATGLVPKGGGWNISDWPYPTVEDAGDYLTVQQLKLATALHIASRAADVLGRAQDRDLYAAHAEKLRQSLVRHLFDAEAGAFRDSSGSSAHHQGVTAYALYAGLVPDDCRQAALRHIVSRPWESRTVLSLPLLRVLFDNGHAAEAYALLNCREYPGWGYMIAQGAKTMWEGWDDKESHSHAWNGYPARLLQEYIAGIRASAPGFKEAVIKPYLPPNLIYAHADVWTAQGTLSAGWEKERGGRIRFRATIPEGVQARFELPGFSAESARVLPPGTHEWVQ